MGHAMILQSYSSVLITTLFYLCSPFHLRKRKRVANYRREDFLQMQGEVETRKSGKHSTIPSVSTERGVPTPK